VIQQTSLMAYREIEIIGTLGRQIRQVYDIFREQGNKTNMEVSKITLININAVTARTNELVKLELLEEKDKRICSVTGRKVIEWGIKYDSPYIQE
jgi:Fic family protein